MAEKEPTLDAVKDEDKGIIRDILRVIQGMEWCSTFAVNVAHKGYEIVCWINTEGEGETEVSYEDLGLIQQVNELRVKVMGLRFNNSVHRACVRVRVISHSEPCMVNDVILYRVSKRTRWFGDAPHSAK